MKVSRVLLIIIHSLMVVSYCIGLIAYFYQGIDFKNNHLILLLYFGLSIASLVFLIKTRKHKVKNFVSNEDLIDNLTDTPSYESKDNSFTYISIVISLILLLTGLYRGYQSYLLIDLYKNIVVERGYYIGLFIPSATLIVSGLLQFYYSKLVLKSFR